MTASVDPETAVETMRAAGFTPVERFVDIDKPWHCRCIACGRVVTPRLSSIGAGGGCKYCATKGLDLRAPASIFIFSNTELAAYVIGFDAADGIVGDRLAQSGWQALKTASVPTVEDAYEVRAAVLRWLRLDRGLPGCAALGGAPDGQGDGSVCADVIAPSDIWAVVSDELSRRRRKRRAAGGGRADGTGATAAQAGLA